MVSDTLNIQNMNRKRVFSGTRATGRLHLGNYLGAVKGYLELQNNPEYEAIYMVMDLHAITTPYDKEKLAQNTRNVIMDYLACGLDPKKSIISAQSLVPEHPYLANIFASVVTIARMQHLPTFKDKVKQYPEGSTMALLNYPVLMAADILVYKAGLVPVGIDQEPHLEVAREIARKMNEKYGTDFPEPVRFATKGEYVPSLTGEGKMSKSVEGSFISLTDDLETIRKKVRAVPTATVAGGEMSVGVKTLFTFIDLLVPNDQHAEELKDLFKSGKLMFSDLKDYVAETIFLKLQPIQEKRKYFEENPKTVDGIISEGAEKARKIASETLKEVKEKMGFIG